MFRNVTNEGDIQTNRNEKLQERCRTHRKREPKMVKSRN